MSAAKIHSTAIVHPGALIKEDVCIGPYALIGEHVQLEAGVRIASHVSIEGHTIIGEDSRIFSKACIGSDPQDLKYEPCESYVRIGARTQVREFVTINPGTNEGEVTQVGDDCLLMAYVHVAHNCTVGNDVIMANLATLAGHVEVHDFAVIGGLVAVHQFVHIGEHVMVGVSTLVLQDILPFALISGNPATIKGSNNVGLKRRGFLEEECLAIKKAYRLIFRSQLTLEHALKEIYKQGLALDPNIQKICHFLEESRSKRGFSR